MHFGILMKLGFLQPPKFSFYDASKPTFTSPRYLPPTKIERCRVSSYLVLNFLSPDFCTNSEVNKKRGKTWWWDLVMLKVISRCVYSFFCTFFCSLRNMCHNLMSNCNFNVIHATIKHHILQHIVMDETTKFISHMSWTTAFFCEENHILF
jgi:hypothetical protein